MLKSQVETGKIYVAKISGKLTRIKLGKECEYGGWYAVNITTGREVRIRSAAKLRREVADYHFGSLKARNLALEIAQGLNTQTHGE